MSDKPMNAGQKAARIRTRRRSGRKTAVTRRNRVTQVNRYTEVAYAVVNILNERGGIVRITQDDWTIYDEVANRLQLSSEERTRETPRGASAIEALVGHVKAALENERIISDVPGQPGTWTLQDGPKPGLVWLMTLGQGGD